MVTSRNALLGVLENQTPEEANIMETETIDCTPSWEATATMLALILESGDDKTWARSEIIRMGQIIDRLQAKEVQA
jgi:hypothetical protein